MTIYVETARSQDSATLRTGARSALRTTLNWLSRRWHSHQLRRERRATIAALRALPAATLKDIGLHRSEIESLVFDSTGMRRRAPRPGGWDYLLRY